MKFLLLVLLLQPALAADRPSTPGFSGTTIQEVKEFISREGITSLEEFLPRLSSIYRASFVLMRRSMSLQPTKDPQKPRAILYGKDGALIFAFNRASDSLEMMERAPSEFRFERLDFVKGQPPTSQNNCQSCHQGHPLWGQYSHWAGMYGGDQENIPNGSPEQKDYLRFVGSAASDPVYKNLIFKCGGEIASGVTPGYVPRELGLPCREASELVKEAGGGDRLDRRLYQPGEGLAEVLNRMNVQRVFLRMKSSPEYAGLAHALAANTLGCLGIRDYDYVSKPAELEMMRTALAAVAAPIEKEIAWRASASKERTLQGKILHLLGVDVNADLRIDLKTPRRIFLGSDCELDNEYSPNPFCQPGSQGYHGFSDGSDLGMNLLGYLVVRDLFGRDAEFRDALSSGLAAIDSHFRQFPPDSGYSVIATREVQADLARPGPDHNLPKYIQDQLLGYFPGLGNGEKVCRVLLKAAASGGFSPSRGNPAR